jgi:hypothetical protein
MKKAIAHISKTSKLLTAILTLFTLIIATWIIIKQFTTKDIAGEWCLKFTVASSSYKAYIGETHTQKIFFCQSDKNITGEGEYNGKLLPFDSHRKVEYLGTMDGSDFKATFKLFGKLRQSSGTICLKVSRDGKSVEGTFSGTAGSSKGTITGVKVN